MPPFRVALGSSSQDVKRALFQKRENMPLKDLDVPNHISQDAEHCYSGRMKYITPCHNPGIGFSFLQHLNWEIATSMPEI